MTTELREYQQELLQKVQAALLRAEKPVMMQLPTGGGKTVIAAKLLSEYLVGGRKAVWLTHRRELASQTEEMLFKEGVSATHSDNWKPGRRAPRIANGAVILMAQTVGRRTKKRPDAKIAIDVWGNYGANDLMIIDEAHHATAPSWERAIKQWPGKVLGMTATPWRLSKKEGFSHLFGNLVLGPQVSELQSQGFLCNTNVRVQHADGRIFGGVVPSHLDYNEKSIEAANPNKEVFTARALKFWQEHAADRQTIIYAVSIGHAENLAALYREAGIPAEVIHSKTNAEIRTRAVEDFTNGKLRVLVNVAIATEGFDIPDASCVVIARPTKSLSLYLQMVGRGLRPKPNGGNCVILDMADNANEHGLPEDERKWSLGARGEADGGGDAPVRICDMCQTASPTASHNCKSCNAAFGKDCPRCKWRFDSDWLLADICPPEAHDKVCDRCHNDAHVRANLPDIPIENVLKRSIQANPGAIDKGFLYKNPVLVAKALLGVLRDMDGEGKTREVIRRVAEMLYLTEGSRLGLSFDVEDVRRYTWPELQKLVFKGAFSLDDAKKHRLLPFPDVRELMKLTPSEQQRQIFTVAYQNTSTHTGLRKSITGSYNQLQKSGHCDPNSPWGVWRLTLSGRERAHNILLQSPTGDD